MKATWLIPLDGDDHDLRSLSHWTHGNAAHVVVFEDRHHLLLPFALVGNERDAACARAATLLDALNGIATLLDRAYHPVALTTHTTRFDEAGQRRDTVHVDFHTSFRILGKALQPGDPGRGSAGPLLDAAMGSEALKDALLLAGRAAPTWSELYVAFELIEAHARERMTGWASKAAMKRFKRTVNSRRALGRLARHGEDHTQPPDVAMPHEEATALIRRLVLGWGSSWAASGAASAAVSGAVSASMSRVEDACGGPPVDTGSG